MQRVTIFGRCLILRCAAAAMLVFLHQASAFGQGRIQGVVIDTLTREPLVGANVLLVGTAMGGVSDREGRFLVQGVPAGSYLVRVSYIGYKRMEVRVTVPSGGTAIVTAALQQDAVQGEEIIITAQVKGQVAAINQQITSNTIVNVISEEKIKELPDANAAEAIGRLPGVSIIRSGGEANKVILRGMSDKFTSFTIDGVRIPATDADSRGVDLSMFSQGTLAGVELFKALTSDKDADAIAGSINLVTRKAPAERTIRFDMKNAYNRLNNYLGQYDFNGRYGERFFDGLLGVQLTGNLERRDRSNEAFNLAIENQEVVGGRGWKYDDLTLNYTQEIRKRGGLGLLLDYDTPEGGSVRGSALYSRTSRDLTNYNRSLPLGGDDVQYFIRDREISLDSFTGSLRGEHPLEIATLTWGASFAESRADNPYDYRMYFKEPSNLIGDSSGMRSVPGVYLNGPIDVYPAYAFNNFRRAYIDTANFDTEKNRDREKTAYFDIAKKYTLMSMVAGEVKVGGKYRFKNRFKESGELFSPYYLNYYQDLTRNPDGSVVPKNFAGTRFANLQMTGRLVLMTNFLDAVPESRGMFDRFSLYPLVNRDALREWYELNKNGVGATGQLEYYGNPEVTADYYDIVERVSAAYLMNTLNIGQAVTLITGIRMEQEANDYTAKYVNTPLGGFPTTGALLDTTASYTETSWLPNIQLVVRPADFMTVRLAAYRAIARPDFSARLDKMVTRVTNPRNPLVIGNPRLRNAKAWNFEANTSFFGNTIGLLSVSAFYREIDDMFHFISNIPGFYQPGTPGSLMDTLGITWRPGFPAGSPISLTYALNSDKPTKVWGLEFEHQATLNFLPGLLSNIVLSYNFSLVRSETYVLRSKVDTTMVIVPPFPFPVPRYTFGLAEAKQKLEGQPEFFGNVALGYDLGGFSGRVSLFFQGEYNRSYSARRTSDPVVKDFSRWDISLRQRVTEYLSVFFNLNNLTSIVEDNTTVNRVDDWEALRSSQRYGLTGDLGIRLEL